MLEPRIIGVWGYQFFTKAVPQTQSSIQIQGFVDLYETVS